MVWYILGVAKTLGSTPPKKLRWNPKIDSMVCVDVFPLPVGALFRFQPLVFRGVSFAMFC